MTYPEIKNANQLTSEVAEAFILSKAPTCTTETLDCYRSNLSALGENINRTFKTASVDLKVQKVAGTTANTESRCKAMTSSDIATLKGSFRPGSTGHTAVTLAEATGCRASELVRLQGKNIEIQGSNSATVFVKGGKGNRDRTIRISDQASVSALAGIKSAVADDQRILNCKSGSIQKSINRHMQKLTNAEGKSLKSDYQNTGFHAIRKNFAQREYDRYRETHTRQESLDYVSAQLGHGEGRDMATLQRYVANIY